MPLSHRRSPVAHVRDFPGPLCTVKRAWMRSPGALGVRQTKTRDVRVVRGYADDADHARGAFHGAVGGEDAEVGAREGLGHLHSVNEKGPAIRLMTDPLPCTRGGRAADRLCGVSLRDRSPIDRQA